MSIAFKLTLEDLLNPSNERLSHYLLYHQAMSIQRYPNHFPHQQSILMKRGKRFGYTLMKRCPTTKDIVEQQSYRDLIRTPEEHRLFSYTYCEQLNESTFKFYEVRFKTPSLKVFNGTDVVIQHDPEQPLKWRLTHPKGGQVCLEAKDFLIPS